MGDSIDLDFKAQFYNLQGTHINERKKCFYKLLKSTSPDISEDQIDIQPRNYQEKIFYVDVLLHFKKIDKLIEILREGVGVLSRKILKQQWFFQEAFKNMSEADIVDHFLPTLSYSLRMKVLKKLSLALSEERMDRIFDRVLERYGLFIAKQFLFSCSPEKIIDVLKNNEIVLLPEQLKRILQKDPDLLKVYFEEYKKKFRKDFDDKHFLTYVAWKHPNLCFELGLHNRRLSMGRSTTRAVIKSNKDEVLKDIKNPCWNIAAIVREVKEFDKQFFFLFFPKSIQDFKRYYYTYCASVEVLVSKYPIKKRCQVLSNAFKQAYNEEIIQYLDKFSDKIRKLFPEEIKQKWAELKYTETESLEYINYCNPEKAFKLLKDKINVTSDIYDRGSLLHEMINVCYEYKDYSTYEEVLKYICMRHRNDDRSLRRNMMNYMKSTIDYNLITEVHWKYINEIVDVQRVRRELLSYHLTAEYLVFVYKKGLPLDGPVTQYAQDCIEINRSFRFWDSLREPEVQSTVLKHIVKILPSLQLDDKSKVTYEIMSNIVDFNKDIKNDKILNKESKKLMIDLNNLTPILDLIMEVCTKEDIYVPFDHKVMNSLLLYNSLYSANPLKVLDEDKLLDIVKTLRNGDCILKVIKKPGRNSFENKLMDYFFSNIEEHFQSLSNEAVKYFLVKEPEVIAKYFSGILTVDVESNNKNVLNYSLIKKYSHLGLDEKLIAHFKELLPLSKYEKKVNLLRALSRVMNTTDFLDLVKDYTPDAKKLDLNDEEQRKMYQVQCDIAKFFKNLDEPTVLAPVLMHFCQGDYLQSSLATLYSVFYRLNEEKASYYINVLSERAMSTRKHAVFLSFEMLCFKDAMTFYSTACSKETNVSAKKYLFNAILKSFIRNPFDTLLDVVFQNMNFMDKNDTEIIKRLVGSVSKIPNKYVPLFIEKVWDYLDVLEQQEVRVTDYRRTVLNTINTYETSILLRFRSNFCENLIKKHFLSNDDRSQKSADELNCFIIKFLLTYLDEQHFEFIFNIIKNYKDLHWESNDNNKIDNILRFFSKTYENFGGNDTKFLKLFETFWQRIFNREECFFEYVLLRLMGLYKENLNIMTFSKEVDKFFQELAEEYGPYVSELLIRSIKDFFSDIDNAQKNTDFNVENFSFYLLDSNRSGLNCFIAFSIIKNSTDEDKKEIYDKVVHVLKDVNNFRIFTNMLLKRKTF